MTYTLDHILYVVLGLIVGIIAGVRNKTLVLSIVLGLIGGVVGGFLLRTHHYISLVTAVVGAVILVAIGSALGKGSKKSA